MHQSTKVKFLEVGSGTRGLSDYVQFEFVACDVKFEGKINSNLLPVIGSSECLPFKDNSFNVVLSSDMLEHIEKRKRETVVNEILRVAKEKAVVACPCDKKSEECERKTARFFKLLCLGYPDWLVDHLRNGLPSEEEILRMLRSNKKVGHFCVLDNENIVVHQTIIILGSIPLLGRMLNGLAKLFSAGGKNGSIINFFNFGTSYRKMFIVGIKGGVPILKMA